MAPGRKKKDVVAPATAAGNGDPVPNEHVTGRMGMSREFLSLEETWEKLEPGFRAVFDLSRAFLEPIKFPYFSYYTLVYNYCINSTKENGRSNPDMYNSDIFDSNTSSALSPTGGPALLTNRIHEFIKSHLVESCKDMRNLQGDELLRDYTTAWESFRFSAKVSHGICQYLNEHFLRKRSDNAARGAEIYPIYGVCLMGWRNEALASAQTALLRAVADVITADRDGDASSAFMVKKVVDCLVDLGLTLDYEAGAGIPIRPTTNIEVKEKADKGLQVYRKYLEVPFLADTRDYYDNESRIFLEGNSVAAYVEKVHQRIKEEEERCIKYLHPSTLAELIKTVEDVLITKQMPKLRAEFMVYLAKEKVEEMQAMYALICRVPMHMDELYAAVETHVRERGLEALALNPTGMLEDPKLFLAAILGVYDRCFPLIERSFKNEKEFRKAFDKGFLKFVNTNAVTILSKSATKTSELFARYCDSILKKGAKNLSESDLEETLQRFMVAFTYIEDKDVFQKFYQKCLCRRLISGLSASDDAEASLISKLKVISGWEYVTKLQRMFQDVSLGVEMNNNFKESDATHRIDWKFESSFQVLAYGSWPLVCGIPISLPAELERPLMVFTEYYSHKHTGRKLNWVYSMSKSDISTNCFKMKHILTVSALQAAVLLTFNHQETVLSLLDIRTSVGMAGADVTTVDVALFKQALLLILKAKILVVTDEAENLEEKDLADDQTLIRLNKGYKGKRMRLNLNQPIRAEVKQEEETATRGIEEDRKNVIQAAIVRVMKMRQQMKHQLLLGEVMELLASRFKPNVAAIKKNIEVLIEKEYIKRNDEERDLYVYVA